LKKITCLFFLTIIIILSGCKRTPEEIFENAVIKYNKKQDTKSKLIIEENLLQDWKAVKVGDIKNYRHANNAIIIKNGTSSIIITSDGIQEPWNKEILFAYYDSHSSRLCISDGFSAEFYQFIYNEELKRNQISKVKEVFLTKDEEKAIDALYMADDTIYYIYNNIIYSLHSLTDEKNVISSDKGKDFRIEPPYQKFDYKIYLKVNKSYAAVTIGDAGKYNLYFIDHQKGDLLLKKSVPSRFLNLSENKLYYITGKTGNWELDRFSPQQNDFETIKSFKSLKDISVSSDKLFFVDENGLNITDSELALEFNENPRAKINAIIMDYLIVTYNGVNYFISTNLYFEVTRKYELLVPNFFSDTSGLTAGELN
jgi:hypothetical protein